MEAGRNSRPRRDGFSPLPPPSLPRRVGKHSILIFSYDDTSPPHDGDGVDGVHARGHAHDDACRGTHHYTPTRANIGEDGTTRRDGVVHVATKAATNARGTASP